MEQGLSQSAQAPSSEESPELSTTPWIVGFFGAVGMFVAGFLPWATGAQSILGSKGPGTVPGFGHEYGWICLVLGLVCTIGWLTRYRRLMAGVALGGLVLAGVVFTAPMAEGSQLGIGLYVYLVAAALATLLALPGGAADFDVEIRNWVNRKLNPQDGESKAIETFIIILIALNVVAVMAETEAGIASDYGDFFLINESISTLIFSVEYILRVWVAPLSPRFAHPVKGRLRYATTGMAIVDIVAIAPFFLMFIQMDLRIARAIRLMRLVRILKIGRYAHAVKMMGQVINEKKEELAITLFVSVMILVLCSSAIYFAEHEVQPEAFSSIPESMWWAVVTLTSVGYGDVSPVSPVGQLVGAVVCMIGVLLVALPTGILASGFLEVMREVRRGNKEYRFDYCPHCGEQLPDDAEPD